jgi:hypothetical protein
MHARSTLLVVERILAPDAAPELVLRDIHLMTVLGGRERTLDEYQNLFHLADLEFVSLATAHAGADVIKATPVAR